MLVAPPGRRLADSGGAVEEEGEEEGGEGDGGGGSRVSAAMLGVMGVRGVGLGFGDF